MMQPETQGGGLGDSVRVTVADPHPGAGRAARIGPYGVGARLGPQLGESSSGTSRTNMRSTRSAVSPAGTCSRRSGMSSRGVIPRSAYQAAITRRESGRAEISSGTAEFNSSSASRAARSSQPSSHACSAPGHAAATAYSSARISEVRTGASVSVRSATTSAGAHSTTAPVFVRTRTTGSTANRCPTASVSGGIDSGRRRYRTVTRVPSSGHETISDRTGPVLRPASTTVREPPSPAT